MPEATKVQVKKECASQVVNSDRVAMIEAANDFVRHMVNKQILPACYSGLAAVEIPLTDQESATLTAALDFLKRQFEAGYRPDEVYQTRVTNEDLREYQVSPPER